MLLRSNGTCATLMRALRRNELVHRRDYAIIDLKLHEWQRWTCARYRFFSVSGGPMYPRNKLVRICKISKLRFPKLRGPFPF